MAIQLDASGFSVRCKRFFPTANLLRGKLPQEWVQSTMNLLNHVNYKSEMAAYRLWTMMTQIYHVLCIWLSVIGIFVLWTIWSRSTGVMQVHSHMLVTVARSSIYEMVPEMSWRNFSTYADFGLNPTKCTQCFPAMFQVELNRLRLSK